MSIIAYFISSHGFGHATRAAAVMSAVHAIDPYTRFEIFTQVPEWMFQVSLTGPYAYHTLATDVGMVQKSPLEEDLDATLRQLAAYLPFEEARVAVLADQLRWLGCCLVVCDIAPLGIAVARRLGLPSVLVENFTWDWIYAGYLEANRRFAPYISALQAEFQSASYRIQTEPVSQPAPHPDLVTPPVGRAARLSRQETRQRLGIPQASRMALVTMGGIQSSLALSSHPDRPEDLYFVFPGASGGASQVPGCICLPFHSDFYYPDLVEACDGIVGKAGYSTLAEAFIADVPFVYMVRRSFRETGSLVGFIQQELGGFEISEAVFLEGSWIPQLVELLEQPRERRGRPNGADQVARYLMNICVEKP